MNPAFTAIKGIFSSRITWAIIAILVVVLVVRANWDRLTGWTRRSYGSFGEPTVGPARKAQLEQLARDAFTAMDGWTLTLDAAWLQQLLALNDLELQYTARFYTDAITRGTKLSDDIDDEWISGDVDSQVVARLRQMNL
jgi:hypothetical protein